MKRLALEKAINGILSWMQGTNSFNYDDMNLILTEASKGVPKRVVSRGTPSGIYADTNEYVCPVCGCGLRCYKNNNKILYIDNYCPYCGQKILWE